MIRLIRRRLIIPRGDTGSFAISTPGDTENSDKAVFCILDPIENYSLRSYLMCPL